MNELLLIANAVIGIAISILYWRALTRELVLKNQQERQYIALSFKAQRWLTEFSDVAQVLNWYRRSALQGNHPLDINQLREKASESGLA